jgi:Effector-associated domain 11/CHAT domain
MTTIELSKISKQLIAQGKLKETLDILSSYLKISKHTDKDYQNLIILLSARFSNIQNNINRGMITNSEVNLEMNTLVYSTLQLIQEIEANIPLSERQIDVESNNNVIINGNINVRGNFSIGSEIKNNEQLMFNLLNQQSKIKILFLSSNPLDARPLRLDKEMRDIELELIRSRHRESFEFIKLAAVRVNDLQNALLEHSPHFVHFSGHGDSDGIALLNNQTDKVKIVRAEPLAQLFKLFSNDIACVFLNSCYSKEQGKLIRKFIPNVIGMKSAVSDNTAIEFATTFYRGIAAGREIGFSFELAKNSIDLNNISGSDIPEYL